MVTVLLNGVSQSTQFNSSTLISTVIQSSAIASAGNLAVAVATPTPGGGTSVAQQLQVIATPNRVRTLNYATADIVPDPVRSLLYSSVLASSPQGANSIIAIDPVQGSVVASAALPSAPDRLAISDYGSYLYVSLKTSGQIERLNLPALTPDITWSLPSNLGAGDIEVAPGSPHTIAVSVHGVSYGTRTVMIYDDAVPRPQHPTDDYPSVSFDTLAWGADASTLYATNAVTSGGPEFVLAVNASGATLTNTITGAFGDFLRRLTYNQPTSLIYDGYGDAVSPSTGAQVGHYNIQNTLRYEPNDIAVDSPGDRVFILNENYFNTSNQGITADIQAFDLNDFSFLNALTTPGLSGSRIVRWGGSGLAVAGGSQIFLLDGTFVNASGSSGASGSYVGVSPTITGISPQAVAAGNGPVNVVITGKDLTPATIATWNNYTLPVTWQNASQVTVTLPASYLLSAVSSNFTLTNGSGTESSNAVPFVVLPNLGPNSHITAMGVSGEEMVWDATRSLFYVAVTDPQAPNGNSIVTVDPAAAAIRSVLPTGFEPYTLDASDDGMYLYVGFETLAAIKRYKLLDGSLDATIPLAQGPPNQNFAGCVRVAPGQNQTIAVSAGSPQLEPRDTGGVAIYDGATPRANSLAYPANAYKFTWGKDATQLITFSDPIFEPQSLGVYAVSSNGIASTPTFTFGSSGLRPHYEPATGLVFADGGTVFDPVAGVKTGVLTSSGLTVPDGTLNRVFVLRFVATNTYALDIFDLHRETLLNSISLPAVAGNPTQILRWGTQGIAILTDGPGMLYLIQGRDISGLSTPVPGGINLSPANLTVGAAGGIVTVTGSSFQPTSTVLVDGVAQTATYVSPTQLSFQLTPAQQGVARRFTVAVSNQASGGTVTPDATLAIDNPVPVIGALSPSAVAVGSSATTITITGSGFVPTTGASLNGSARPATYISPTSLSVALPSTDFSAAGTSHLILSNAGPGGGTSGAANLQIVYPSQ